MISVVIPVMDSEDITKHLFEQISQNTFLPAEIFLIDNGTDHKFYKFYKFHKIFPNLNIQYIRCERNMGVDIAWNEGIYRSNSIYISILNNDIVITKYFFEKIYKSFAADSTMGVVVPNTVDAISELYDDNGGPCLIDLPKREGWAFTIKKEITEQCGPIPHPFKIYYGDDYLFSWAKKLGYSCKKIINNPIYHFKSLSVQKVDSSNSILHTEGKFWKKYYPDFCEGK